VAKNGAGATWGDWAYQDATFGGVRAGVYCQPDNNGNCTDPNPDSTWGMYRSFLNFSIPSSIWGSAYVDAQLQTTMKWAWSCSPGTQVNLYYTNTANRGMNWPGPSEKGLLDSSTRAYRNGDSSCNQNGVNFDATGAARAAAGNHDGSITLELRANDWDESHWNVYSWRRFDASSMNLQINYRHAPDTPTGPLTQGVFDAATGQTVSHCAGSSPGDYVNAPRPVIQAADNDSDGSSGKITTEFNWTNLNSGLSYNMGADEGYQSPSYTFHGTWPGDITDGNSYKWQVNGATQPYTDGIGNSVPSLNGPSSSWCYFTEDRTPPTAPANSDITSDVYTSGAASGQVGQPGHFTFSDPANSDNGVNDVAGYYYGLDNSSPGTYVPAGSDHKATVTITPFNPAELDLYVRAVDRAGNVSQGAAAEFKIVTKPPNNNIATLAWWKLNEGSGTTAIDATGNGNDAALWQPGASLGCGSSAVPSGYRCTLALDGSAGRAFTARPVLGNNGPFTVSAWVYLNSAGGSDQTAMSQGGNSVSGFTLGYAGACRCWQFAMPSSDSLSPTSVYQARSGTVAQAGTWTQLTGVFDPAAINPDPKCSPGVNCVGALTLYVNGVLAGQYWGAREWSAPAAGLLRLGSDGTAGAGPPFWGGQLSAACAFYGPLPASDVTALWAKGSGDGCGVLYQKYP
jgi:hypothetical protein